VTTPASVTLTPGETKQLSAEVNAEEGADKTVNWSSNDTSNKVTVDEDGLVSVAKDAVLGDYEVKAASKVDENKFGMTTIKVISKSDDDKDDSETGNTGTGDLEEENLIITKQPKSLSLRKGQTAIFEIEVRGTAPFNYQWQKDDKDLEDNKKISGSNEEKLNIEGVAKSDEGEYSCIVTDGIGNITTSSAVTLRVRSKSSNGGSSSTNSNSQTTANRSDTTVNELNKINIPYTRPLIIANVTIEESKAIMEKIITGIGTVLGEGTTVEQTKDIVASNGTKLNIASIIRNGNNIGAIIIPQASSNGTIIPINGALGGMSVYKYVPLIDRYIKLTEGVAINSDKITLLTEANALYVATTTEIPETETIKQGWAYVDNSWYMFNAAGNPQVGWQKDSVGWAYLSETNGVMQTGWLSNGGRWYYLRANGYMATGWIKDRETWYYCNPDGSMAANITIDGYQLGSNGAWVG
jgi:hypothetical protein